MGAFDLYFILAVVVKRKYLKVTVTQEVQYAVPQKIQTHPMEGHQKFLGGGGPYKSKFVRKAVKRDWRARILLPIQILLNSNSK